MAKRDILKEAIADAKTVKDTAIANAKAALEEAFTPQLKSMLAAKLEEMGRQPQMEKEAVQQTQVLSRMEKAKNKVTLSDEPKKGTKVKSRKTKYKTVKRKG